MPRSATDATRFTSTTPHASAKLPSRTPPNPLPPRNPGPPGETPQEKVRRLRAAADKARDAQVPTFDKVILSGRVWADRLHRFTALSLIGITVLCGGVTAYALGDMMIYNRRKRAQFYEEQKGLHVAAVHNARLAIQQGIATEDDFDFIRREEEETVRMEAIKAKTEAKAAQKGIFAKGRDWLFSGLKKEEESDDVGSSERRFGYESLSEEDNAMGERESDIIRAIEDKKESAERKVKQAFTNEKERQRSGGPLDRLGTSVEHATGDEDDRPKSGGWTSFMTRR